MQKIAIIDDNSSQSGTLKKIFNYYLKKANSDMVAIDQFPFRNPDDYLDFIYENNVRLLILDEKLNQLPTPEGVPVEYRGNELVDFLRERLKDFPIVMVS